MDMESITKALHCAQFARNDLRQALKTASPTEAIILLYLIGQAARLKVDISNLESALKQEASCKSVTL